MCLCYVHKYDRKIIRLPILTYSRIPRTHTGYMNVERRFYVIHWKISMGLSLMSKNYVNKKWARSSLFSTDTICRTSCSNSSSSALRALPMFINSTKSQHDSFFNVSWYFDMCNYDVSITGPYRMYVSLQFAQLLNLWLVCNPYFYILF